MRGENCGCGTTRRTSFTTARRPSNVISLYLPFVSTQCAAVSTRSDAIATPEHKLCPPTISTTWRAMIRSASVAPPTMAATGGAESASIAAAASSRRTVPLPAAMGFLLVGPSLPLRLARVAFFLLEKGALDFIMNAQQPCLGASGAIAEMDGLGLEVARPFFGGAQLE